MNARKSKAVEITSDLIDIKSESLRDGEKEVSKYISDYLKGIGIDSEITEFSKGRSSVIAQIGKGEGLMLNGHIDTVPAGDLSLWNHGPQARLIGNRLYGRGASDMKGGLGSILAALKEVDLSKPKRRVVLAFVADEEISSRGSLWLLKQKRKIFKNVKYGLIAEPTNLKIQVAQKGALHLTVEIKGKSAHGSAPWEGDNAISRAANFVSGLDHLSKNFKKKDKLMGKGTINVGLISGGTAANVVPEKCEVSVDRRIIPSETIPEAISQVKRILDSQGTKYKINVKFAHVSYSIPKESFLPRLVKSASKSQFSWATGYTEAELYKTSAHIDSVVFGPGIPSTIHKPDEFVTVENLNKATSVFKRVMEKWI